jgi:hypothetical protein
MSDNIMTRGLANFDGPKDGTKTIGADMPHRLNRYMGGHYRKNHPFISGYWYLVILPPKGIFSGANSVDMARNWMHSTAESFTPPSKTLTKVDVPGMGGMASSYVAGQEINREFSCTFREYQNLPISTAIRTWASIIDTHLGRSPLNNFSPDQYKGSCYAILCKPTVGDKTEMNVLSADHIEQVYYMEGVFPTTVPDDAMSADISTNDVAQLSVSFSFDGGYFTKENPSVVESALAALNAVNDLNGSITDDSLSHSLNNLRTGSV